MDTSNPVRRGYDIFRSFIDLPSLLVGKPVVITEKWCNRIKYYEIREKRDEEVIPHSTGGYTTDWMCKP